MTTFINFVPSTVAPFSFQATLDGDQYNVVVTWNVFGQRFYVNVYAADGTLVVCRALVGSPTGLPVQAASWSQGRANLTTTSPHGYKIGTIITLTVTGMSPAAYNGTWQALITGPSTFSFPLASYPGASAAFGAASYNVDLVGGYFATSTLVFRQSSMQFEVFP